MIPSLTTNGLLPKGIHKTSWTELVDRFGITNRRESLLIGLRKALRNLKESGCKNVYIDGSFVTCKHSPNDIDCCWDTSNVDFSKLDPVFLDFSSLRAAQKAKYSCEFFPSNISATHNGEPYLSFFQKDKNTGDPKGLLVLNLEEFDND